MCPQLSGKRLELLKEAFPKISRVAVFVDTVLESLPLAWRETRAAADTDAAFKTATSQRADALMTLAGPVIELHRKRVVDLAAKSRLSTMYPTSGFVEVGGLMSYGPDRLDLVRRAATYVDKLLKGAKPADLPVEQPTKFELAVNLKTARALGLTIPQTILIRADRVIE